MDKLNFSGLAAAPGARHKALLARVAGRLCLLPLDAVIEVMPPLSVEPDATLPGFVRGAAIIRGHATPVLDLHALLGAAASARRYVTARLTNADANAEPAVVALAVDEVMVPRDFEAAWLDRLPSLLAEAPPDRLAAVAAWDGGVARLLQTIRVVQSEPLGGAGLRGPS